MTGFVHAGGTDDRTAGPDCISAVETDGQGKINIRERRKSTAGQTPTERNTRKISPWFVGAACRGQQRATRNPWEVPLDAGRGLECYVGCVFARETNKNREELNVGESIFFFFEKKKRLKKRKKRGKKRKAHSQAQSRKVCCRG